MIYARSIYSTTHSDLDQHLDRDLCTFNVYRERDLIRLKMVFACGVVGIVDDQVSIP